MATAEKLTFTITEAAEVLGVSRPTLYRLIHTEGFPVLRLFGRTLISRAGLVAWIEQKTGGQKP